MCTDVLPSIQTDLPPMPTAQREELMKMNPASKWSFIQANNPETVAKLVRAMTTFQDDSPNRNIPLTELLKIEPNTTFSKNPFF